MKTAETGYADHHAPRPALRVHAHLAAEHIKQGLEVPAAVVAALTDTPTKTARGAVTAAYVNGGRWVVDCPFCTAAQLASATDHVYLCHDCGNATIQGEFVKVAWPDDETRAAIEKELARRPPQFANWFPHETADDLRAENIEHGITS